MIRELRKGVHNMATNLKVKQTDLSDFRKRAEKIASIEKSLKQLKEEQEREEATLLMAMRKKIPFERGPLLAAIRTTERRSPKWKNEYARALGPDAVQTVIDALVPTVYEHVAIVEAQNRK